MIESRYLNKVVAILMVLALVLSAMLVLLAGLGATSKVMAYESKLFGEEVVILDIQVDEADWQSLLDDPSAKTYIPADLTINGETYEAVGMRTKGNSSLTQVEQMQDSNRYSLHFKFNKYQKGRTYYGLDSFCINNMLGDTTYMKDYLAYEIMDYIGVPSPLRNYAKVTVNGEDYGFFMVLERYEKSFLDRVYSTSGGQLYNVKIQMGHREDFMDQKMDQDQALPDLPPDLPEEWAGAEDFQPGQGDENRPSMPGQGNQPSRGQYEGFRPGGQGQMQERPGQNHSGDQMGMTASRGGGDLVYTDDKIESYSSIFDNAEFKKNSDQDKRRVITALKNLNEGTDLETYFDVDGILRYLAAHTVLVNLDSYSSSMAQNYYLYEKDGKISILPWDYGLSFGGFQSNSAQSVINFPISTPVSGVTMESRPLINQLLEVEEYQESYHEYLNEIVEGYFNSGQFEASIDQLNQKIGGYVKQDSSAFITYSQYEASLPVLKELGLLRAASIEGQLAGSIPSTTEGQSANPDALISGQGIDLTILGSFMNGGGQPVRSSQGEGRRP
ncbi:MAG: spore coat protein CotH [Clostridiaceae bacterium]|nr:spore coat protein CotH [Clostridiaceae bacterium]